MVLLLTVVLCSAHEVRMARTKRPDEKRVREGPCSAHAGCPPNGRVRSVQVAVFTRMVLGRTDLSALPSGVVITATGPNMAFSCTLPGGRTVTDIELVCDFLIRRCVKHTFFQCQPLLIELCGRVLQGEDGGCCGGAGAGDGENGPAGGVRRLH